MFFVKIVCITFFSIHQQTSHLYGVRFADTRRKWSASPYIRFIYFVILRAICHRILWMRYAWIWIQCQIRRNSHFRPAYEINSKPSQIYIVSLLIICFFFLFFSEETWTPIVVSISAFGVAWSIDVSWLLYYFNKNEQHCNFIKYSRQQ